MTDVSRVSQPTKDVTEDLSEYEYQLKANKNALKEKAQGVSSSTVAHGITGGVPIALKFRIVDSNTVEAMADSEVDGTNFDPSSQSSFYRIFYNRQAEA